MELLEYKGIFLIFDHFYLLCCHETMPKESHLTVSLRPQFKCGMNCDIHN